MAGAKKNLKMGLKGIRDDNKLLGKPMLWRRKMTNNEHPDQEKYEGIALTVSQWEQVIEKAKSTEKSDLHIYIEIMGQSAGCI